MRAPSERDRGSRVTQKVLVSFPINELLLTKAKGRIVCIVSRGVRATGRPPVNSLHVFTAASEEDAAWMGQTCVELKGQWHAQVRTVVLRNFSEASVANPLVRRVARKHGKLPEQVLVRWLIARWLAGYGCLCIPAGLNPTAIERVLGIAGWELPPSDMTALVPIARDFRCERKSSDVG